MPVGDPGLRSTRQYWGALAPDGISFTRLLELTVLAAPGQPDQPLSWAIGGVSPDNVMWRVGGVSFQITWVSVTRPEIEQFITDMRPRDPANPLAGFDAQSLPLQAEQISDGTPMSPESWLDIDLTHEDGRTMKLTISNRAGIADSLGLSLERVNVGARVALVSPAAFTDLTGSRTLDWAGDGIQYRVGATKSDLATVIEIAEAVDDVGDRTWLNLLSTDAQDHSSQQDPPLLDPSATTLGPVRFTLPADAVDFLRPGALPDFVVAHHMWSIGDQGTVIVTVQSEVPLFPPDQLVEEFDANGLHWRVYDTGPANGSITTAYAQIGLTAAVLVGGQAWTDSGASSHRTDVLGVVRSLQYQPT